MDTRRNLSTSELIDSLLAENVSFEEIYEYIYQAPLSSLFKILNHYQKEHIIRDLSTQFRLQYELYVGSGEDNLDGLEIKTILNTYPEYSPENCFQIEMYESYQSTERCLLFFNLIQAVKNGALNEEVNYILGYTIADIIQMINLPNILTRAKECFGFTEEESAFEAYQTLLFLHELHHNQQNGQLETISREHLNIMQNALDTFKNRHPKRRQSFSDQITSLHFHTHNEEAPSAHARHSSVFALNIPDAIESVSSLITKIDGLFQPKRRYSTGSFYIPHWQQDEKNDIEERKESSSLRHLFGGNS